MGRKRKDLVLRKPFTQYPILETALPELARSGLYGDGTVEEVIMSLVREAIIKMVAEKSVFIPKTLAEIERRKAKAAPQ